MNLILNILIFISLLSLGGLPPFLGFFPKWLIIELLILNKIFFNILILLFFTLITLFFYLRISYNSFLILNNEISW
jgi:NADH-ubiquinone oxidoreductase chain 2